jgi:hypothetical protein
LIAIDADEIAYLEQWCFRMAGESECLVRLRVQEFAFNPVLLTTSINGQNDNQRPLALVSFAKRPEPREASSTRSAKQFLNFAFAATRWSIRLSSVQ